MFVPKFKIPGVVIPQKSLTRIFRMHYTGVKDGEKKEKGKKKSKEISVLSLLWFSLTQDHLTLCWCIQNMKTLALLLAEKSVMKKFYWRKRKNLTNKGNNKHQGPVVQSVVSLTSSLRVISLIVLADSIYSIMIFLLKKCE